MSIPDYFSEANLHPAGGIFSSIQTHTHPSIASLRIPVTPAKSLRPDSPLIPPNRLAHTSAHTFQTQITLCGVSQSLRKNPGLMRPRRRAMLLATAANLLKAVALSAQSWPPSLQTRLLWRVKQLWVCLGLSVIFHCRSKHFIRTMKLLPCQGVTHHFSLGRAETLGSPLRLHRRRRFGFNAGRAKTHSTHPSLSA